MKDIWNIKYNWILSDNTWICDERLDQYWSGVTYVPDNYFKYQKCLSGITYQYVNKLDDIYNKNQMVGKSWCIYNMYNEFDIINNFMVNIDTVDVCSTTNLDLTQRYYTIDNAYLKTKHKVILVNQTNNTENGLYNIDQRGYLISSNYLADSGNTFRYKAYIKLGDNKHSEYHLKNSGDYFPTLSQPSDYMSGKTYIIKNFFNYDINAYSPVPKLIFTDYDIARHLNPLNQSLYTGFTMSSVNDGDILIIKYHDYSGYTITIDSSTNKFIYTDTISGSTLGFWYDLTGSTFYVGEFIDGLPSIEIGFIIKVDSTFYNNSNVGDYLKIEFSGNTNLIFNTFIYYKDPALSTSIVLRDQIPQNLLEDFFISGGTYTITNLQWSLSGNTQNTLNDSYYSKYFDVDSSMYISPKYYPYNHYFDYDGLEFILNGTSGFTTNNYYIKYKLFEHLNSINPSIFDNSYYFSNWPVISITNFTTGFTAFNEIQSSEYQGVYPKGTYIKITPINPSDMYFFKKHTFIELNSDPTLNTLIVDLVPNEYFIIETYKSDSGLTIRSIDNLYSLTGISSMLYYVYMNENNQWYRKRDDDMRKNICNAYARIIENDTNITKYTTALLTQDDKHKFILEMYNPENLNNNSGIQTISYDPNLTYKPIELIEIGVDKHTRIPIPILNENLLIIHDTITGTTSGSTTGTTSSDIFSFEVKFVSLINFNYILHSISPTTLNIDWGDGTLETILVNGGYSSSHSYVNSDFYLITFQGNLQYIDTLTATGRIISSDISKLKNLISLNLSNNPLPSVDISQLIYITNLNLSNNLLTDSDLYFNILDSFGTSFGNIDTSGGYGIYYNSSVTSTSNLSRTNLGLKGWTLTFNP